MNELDAKFFVGLSWHFGGGPRSYFSGTAGVGVSKRFGPVEPGVNLGLNFYNGGMGTRSDSNAMNFDLVLTGKVTAGTGNANPMSVYPLHMDSGTGMEDTYKYSATIGTSMILNNNNRNQQVGFVQLRANDFGFQFYNDFGGFKKIGIADGYDRWWTGGGKVILGNNTSSYQMIVGSDVFTADTDSENVTDEENATRSLEEFNRSNTGSWFDKTKSKAFDYTPTTASEVGSEFLSAKRNGVDWTKDAHSFDLNQGRTSFHGRTPQGSFGINGIGSGHMYSQDMIHRFINFHLIPSQRPNYWEVQTGPNINTGF
jgi:hypothetical protein